MVLPAQVMWNLKGGIMPANVHHLDDDTEHKVNWMLGLEMEIPLSQKLNLETGLRYKNETACWGDDYSDPDHTVNHLELPIRCTYKYKLRENLLLRAGIGPYLGVGLKGDGVSPKIGIEPSVAVDWKCLSLGLTYNKPYYVAERGKYEANSGLMLTVGVRFHSRAWKYIGPGLLAAGAVAGTVYTATQGNNSSSNYSPNDTSHPSSSDYSSSNSSSNSDKSSSEAKLLDQYHRWERSAQGTYNALTNTGYKVKKEGKVVSGSTAQSWGILTYSEMKRLLRKAQKEMEKIRIKAAKKGIDIPKSEYEDVQIKW